MLFLPVYVFLGCGIAECLLQYAKMSILGSQDGIRFTIFLFGTAGTIGIIVLLVTSCLKSWQSLPSEGVQGVDSLTNSTPFAPSKGGQSSLKNIIAGIALGVPNYFSVHFLLEVLGSGMEGSVAFPINNISIIVLSALLAWLIFSEKLSKINVAGIVLAVVSIVLIAVSS